MTDTNPVLEEAYRRGDYAVFAYQLRYGSNPKKFRKRDIKKALRTIDRLAYERALDASFDYWSIG